MPIGTVCEWSPRRRGRRALVALIVAMTAFAAVGSAAVAATEEQQGARLLDRVQAGELRCASLTSADFDRIGEYVMERMLGSPVAHEAMNRQMTAMMGSGGERQAHVFFGQRFSGCVRGRTPASSGAMMGMMGAGMMGSAAGSASRMGNGGVVGLGNVSASSDSGWSSADTVTVVLMGLLLALAVGALLAWHPWRRARAATPLETLQGRLARGEIDRQEYDRRRQALEGPA